jgi:hypothetical protein
VQGSGKRRKAEEGRTGGDKEVDSLDRHFRYLQGGFGSLLTQCQLIFALSGKAHTMNSRPITNFVPGKREVILDLFRGYSP